MATTKAKASFASIWKKLSVIDCSDHIKAKNGANYLSWAWAWGILMDNYPEAEFKFQNFDDDMCCVLVDSTAIVECTVDIGGCCRTMFLPVMTGYSNAAKTEPNARDVCDARMRCLVKCLGLFGLGFYIYAGEDLPPITPGVIPDSTIWSYASYGFNDFAEMQAWVLEHKKVEFSQLDPAARQRLVDFFASYRTRAEWPEKVR
tara:strand:- start:5139 stop:5747 length:609 start_codon:yes stop_codon:yes gene_type:complete